MSSYIIPLIVAILASQGIWGIVLYKMTRRDKKKDEEEKKLEDQDGDMAAVKTALKGLLHQEIIRQGKNYREKGKISKEELDDFRVYLYLPYKALDGNGVADVVMDELIALSKGVLLP